MGGESGHNAPMIAYDALLGCEGSLKEAYLCGMLHGGDSDSTGVIVGTCWGAWHGYQNVPGCHYKKIAFCKTLREINNSLIQTKINDYFLRTFYVASYCPYLAIYGYSDFQSNGHQLHISASTATAATATGQ